MARLLAAIAAMLTVSFLAPVQPASAASAGAAEDCYAPETTTEVVIDAEAEVAPGEKVRIAVEVRADSEESPTGTLEIRVDAKRGGGTTVFSQTYNYSGDPVVAEAGPFSPGAYDITATFTAEECSGFRDSTATQSFRVVGNANATDTGKGNPSGGDDGTQDGAGTQGGGADGVQGGAGDNAAGGTSAGETRNSGVLPDTGGPAAWWLLLALVLVGGGAGALYHGRRRSASA